MAWIGAQADVDLYVSVITIGEIRKGIESARPTNPNAAAQYEAWLEELLAHYGNRIIPFDEPAAQAWGTLMARSPTSNVEDSQTAAIAQSRGMTVVTRNTPDFQHCPGPTFDPF
jgi:predicted nucleic acid-binding protein